MDDSKGNFPSTRSWRDIPQEVKPRAMSRTGRKRHSMEIAKVVCGVLFIAAAAWGTVALVNAFEYQPQKIAKATQSAPLRRLTLNTDGVLSRDWVLRTLAIAPKASLMEVDLDVLHPRLLASGQIRMALLSKSFPDTLNVTLTERSPVARIKVQDGDGPLRELFVARDGVVFEGEGFDQRLVDELPFLTEGVRLVRSKSGGIAPIPGMEVVSDLLTKARYEGGQLYSLFKHISLARLASDGEIEVRSPECEGLVFNTRDDFFRQIAYLDYIFNMRDVLQPSPEAPLARIDLSHGRSVPVTVSRKPTASVAATAPASRSGSAAIRASQGSGTPQVASNGPAPRAGSSSGQGGVQLNGRTLQAPTRPSNALPAFQNFQRNTTQREL